MKKTTYALAGLVVLAAGCASVSDQETAQKALAVMKASFNEKGQAKLDRLDQDETQKACSRPESEPLPKDEAAKIEKLNFASIKYPADGKMLGDWREGEKIAQSGVGKQYSDDPKKPSGGNCYACHQMSKTEISYGTIGPSLYQYGKLRGNTEAVQRYTWGKVWNSNAYTACSNMPRFGHNGILTEKQIRDVTALLLDPASPVNQ
ncbi:MAG: sulfur oxidation c-type cytochrome SoxX [Proteobacteria bacterium]|nr:sulfur oxidation c-type cytochrome SoxX [Pseudomonadota bacterium]